MLHVHNAYAACAQLALLKVPAHHDIVITSKSYSICLQSVCLAVQVHA